MSNPDAVLSTERVLPFTPQEIYAAIQNPKKLAQWWGPEGFTNTFEQFEFEVGGKWVFVMHGPNGANYPNENVFDELVLGEKVVIRHASQPHFTLTITLTPREAGTHLVWAQEFETAAMAEQLRGICDPANEQNLDRLQAVLAGETP
jgi:uncharacterized protein YndB with AHSA1/START domain